MAEAGIIKVAGGIRVDGEIKADGEMMALEADINKDTVAVL